MGDSCVERVWNVGLGETDGERIFGSSRCLASPKDAADINWFHSVGSGIAVDTLGDLVEESDAYVEYKGGADTNGREVVDDLICTNRGLMTRSLSQSNDGAWEPATTEVCLQLLSILDRQRALVNTRGDFGMDVGESLVDLRLLDTSLAEDWANGVHGVNGGWRKLEIQGATDAGLAAEHDRDRVETCGISSIAIEGTLCFGDG